MDARNEKRDAGTRSRCWMFDVGGWGSRLRALTGARLFGLVVPAGLATLGVTAALLVGFRDTPGVRRADAAAIGSTATVSTNPQASGPPANDNFNSEAYFSTPFTLPGNTFHVSFPESTAGATLEAGETASCGPMGATVWFAFSPDRAATVVIDTAGSDFDTILAGYTLAAFVPSPPGGAGSLTPLACNDDSGGAQSRITMNVEPNVL
jgi:hypothetical protein